MKPPKEVYLPKGFVVWEKCRKIIYKYVIKTKSEFKTDIKYLHSDEAVPKEQYDRVVGLLEKLIGRVNRVTSRHLHKGVEVTEQDLNRLVDCQHEVEEILKTEGV